MKNTLLCKVALRHQVFRDKRQEKHSTGQKNTTKQQNKTNKQNRKYPRYFLLRENDTYFSLWGSLVLVLPSLLYANGLARKFWCYLVLNVPCQILMGSVSLWVISDIKCGFPGPAWMLTSMAEVGKGLYFYFYFLSWKQLTSSSFLHTRLVTVILVLSWGAKVA